MRTLMLFAVVLGVVSATATADGPPAGIELPKGYRATLVRMDITDDHGFLLPGVWLDIIAETDGPTKTSIALLNVQLLAVDMAGVDAKLQNILVAATPAQAEVIELMEKHKLKAQLKAHKK